MKRVFVMMMIVIALLPAAMAKGAPMTEEEILLQIRTDSGREWMMERYLEEDGGVTLSLSWENDEDGYEVLSLVYSLKGEEFVLQSFSAVGLRFVRGFASEEEIAQCSQGYIDLYDDGSGMLRAYAYLQKKDADDGDGYLYYMGSGDPGKMHAFTLRDFDPEAVLSLAADVIRERNEPIFIPTGSSPYALAQPQQASFKKTIKYPVYTGPGTQYVRQANGKASVSTVDWIQVFGKETVNKQEWLLIQYHVDEDNNRFGWICASQEEAGVIVPEFSWANKAGVVEGTWMTNDPLRNVSELEHIGAQKRPCTLLALLGDLWAYVETTDDRGTPVRAFVSRHAIDLAADYSGTVTVKENGTPLYTSPGGVAQTTLERGALMLVLGEEQEMFHVCLYLRNDDDRGAGRRILEGYVHAQDVYEDAWPEESGVSPQLCEAAWSAGMYDALDGPVKEAKPVAQVEPGEQMTLLAYTGDYAYVRFEYDDSGAGGYLLRDVLMPVTGEEARMGHEMHGCESWYVQSEGAVLYTAPDESSRQIAAFVRGMDVRILREENGWCFVDAWGSEDGIVPNLRGYIRKENLQKGILNEKTHPVMRLCVPEGEDFRYIGQDCLNGTEMILRAVTADGQYGICMINLSLPAAAVPMAYLEDTGRREEWNYEGMGMPCTLREGTEKIPFWFWSGRTDCRMVGTRSGDVSCRL